MRGQPWWCCCAPAVPANILGAIVYALRKPDPWPRVFGFHEIFHCGTVAGYACHMVAIYMVIVSLWQ